MDQCTLCPEVEKSDFSCSCKPPKIQISESNRFFLLQYLYLLWFYVVLNIAFPLETKVLKENSFLIVLFLKQDFIILNKIK